MKKENKVALMLSVPRTVRNKLRIMAAKENLKNPDSTTSASTIAKEILCSYLENIKLDELK